MRKTIVLVGLLFTVLALAGAGCNPFDITGEKPGLTEGGVFKSVDKAENWRPMSQLLTLGTPRAFNQASITSLALDPQDHNAIYAASAESGLFFSYIAGVGWQQPDQIRGGAVQTAAVDPRNKCAIYAVIGNLILRSDDCNRTYAALYQETRPEVTVRALAIDPVNNNILYAGNSAGDIIKSLDRGRSWSAVKRLGNAVTKIIINPLNTNILYVATQERGLFRSGNGGLDWTEMNEGLKKYGGAYVYHDLVLMDARAETLLLASQYGLIKSGDAGVTWQALELLTPPNGADIKVVAVSPISPAEIFYATPSTFYKSADGGLHWVTKKLPSAREPDSLIIDSKDPKVFYMGFAPVKK